MVITSALYKIESKFLVLGTVFGDGESNGVI